MSNKRSISDDDLCSGCAHCDYRPGELSSCSKDWPGTSDADGYVTDCKGFDIPLYQDGLMERKLETEIERRSKMEPSEPIRTENRNYVLDGQVHSIEIPIRLLNGEEVTSGEDWYELELALAKKLIGARCMGRESLRFIRKSFGKSIKEFAKSIDSEASTVAGWESGKLAIDERVASYYHALGDSNDTH